MGAKHFQKQICDLGFTYMQNGDKHDIDALFESLRRNRRDRHVEVADITKVFVTLKVRQPYDV